MSEELVFDLRGTQPTIVSQLMAQGYYCDNLCARTMEADRAAISRLVAAGHLTPEEAKPIRDRLAARIRSVSRAKRKTA